MFPWRIFSRIAALNSLLVFLATLSSVVFISLFSEVTFRLGSRTFVTAVTLFCVLEVLALIFSFIFVRPIQHLLGRASLRNDDAGSASASGDWSNPLSSEIFGEWSDLESSISEIRRDLVSKAESLRIEREELATLMSAISDGILAVDTDGRPLFFNSRFSVVFEMRSQTMRLKEIFRQPEILEAYESALSRGEPTSVRAFPIEVDHGPKHFFSLSISPLRRQGGVVYGAVGIFHDVTELKAAEQIRIDFVANVSHELRTPLTSIKGYADTLLQDVRGGRPVAPEFLDVILRNVERLMALINDLLDLSSLESAESPTGLTKSPVETRTITERVLQQIQGALGAKQHQVITRFGSPMVWADSQRLEQVLVNLLDNATKYTPPGGTIEVEWLPHGSAETRLQISDTGPGIPAEHLPRLFERFYRVDKARSREQGGTGLGLAIVKHILQSHEGKASVESKVGRGSTFICDFPNT